MNKELVKLEADFNLQLEPTSIKGAMKAVNASSKDLWIVNYKELQAIPNFNVRVFTDRYKTKIREYADSMLANGWLPSSVLEGYAALVDGEQVIYYNKGHTRLLALELANSEGAGIECVPIVVNTKGVSMDDLQVALIQDNEANPLPFYEKMIPCMRLHKAGWNDAEISRRTGVKPQQLAQMYTLWAAPHKLKELVAFETISATFALDMINEHGVKALDVILAAAEKAPEGKKVTKRLVEGANFKKAIKKAAPDMLDALTAITSDDAFSFLPDVLKAKVINLLAELDKSK